MTQKENQDNMLLEVILSGVEYNEITCIVSS